ncbi:MAG: DUF3598 family protein [Elainella sp. Prado103]|nr:DUF3598 family protein [Elainella sp. Prado103]
MISQWDCLLKNLGVWQGSFAHFSPLGIQQDEIPSRVTLAGVDDNRTIRQTIQKYSVQGNLIYDRVLEYSSLNRSILFCETGAFSQGSLQYGLFAEFGAELGLIEGQRRFRLVQLFDRQGELSQLTLMREQLDLSGDLSGDLPAPATQLSQPDPSSIPTNFSPTELLSALVGTWIGEAKTYYPDWREPTSSATHLTVAIEGNQLFQTLQTGNFSFSSVGQMAGSVIRFDQGNYPIQVVLLPGGGSSNAPISIPRGQAFFLEAGWLMAPDRRQRLIRSYDAKGEWVSLTLVTEKKVRNHPDEI